MNATTICVLRKLVAQMMPTATKGWPTFVTSKVPLTPNVCTVTMEIVSQDVWMIQTARALILAKITSVKLLLEKFSSSRSQSKLRAVMGAQPRVLLLFSKENQSQAFPVEFHAPQPPWIMLGLLSLDLVGAVGLMEH